MFGDILSFNEIVQVTLFGLGTVFFVLISLAGGLELFRFIPIKSSQKESSSHSIVHNGTEIISPTTKAIIVAAILENMGENNNKVQIRIKNIKKIN